MLHSKQHLSDGKIKRKYLCGIFKTIVEGYHKSYHFLGIKIYSKIKLSRAIRKLHSRLFPQFKEIHKGKDVVIVATGPTLNQYIPTETAVYIGVNRAFMYDKIKLDYLFSIDYDGAKEYIELAKDYPCKKFYGMSIPEHVAKEAGAHRIYTHDSTLPMQFDIETAPVLGFGTVVFPALQFAFYTGAKRIFLVGCDCTSDGHFNGKEPLYGLGLQVDTVLEGYKKVKAFAEKFYPDIEIISVNPIGLKGVFKDI